MLKLIFYFTYFLGIVMYANEADILFGVPKRSKPVTERGGIAPDYRRLQPTTT